MLEIEIDITQIKNLYLNELGGITIIEKGTDEVYDYDDVKDINSKFTR